MITNSYIAEFFYKSAQIFVGEYLVHGRQFAGLFVFRRKKEAIFGITNLKSRWRWMISKMANDIVKNKSADIVKSASMKKTANPLFAHLLQNLAGRLTMSAPKMTGTEKMFLRNMVKPDEGMATLTGNAIYGFGKSMLPELGMLNEQFAHLGKSLQKNLAEKGMSLADLSNRDIVVLRRALAGDFAKALESNSPLANELVGSVVGAYNPQLKALFDKGILTPNMIRRKAARQAKNMGKDGIGNLRSQLPIDEPQLPITPEQAQKLLEGFGKTWKENRLTSNLANAINTKASHRYGFKSLPNVIRPHKKGLAQKLVEVNKGEDTALRKTVRGGADIAGNALLSLDPLTLGWNGVKRLVDAKWLGKIKPGKTLQDNLQDFFVTQPVQNSFGKGMKGDYVQPLRLNKGLINDYREAKDSKSVFKTLKNHALETLDSQVVNPYTAATKHLSNGLGKAVHDAGITPAQLASFAAQNSEKYPILAKLPAEPRGLVKSIDFTSNAAKSGWKSFREGLKNIPSLLRDISIG